MAKRRERKETKGVDFMKPIDVTAFGTADDPCFGKLYNLSTNECKRCGDSELCCVVFAQNMKKERTSEKVKSRFKDEELDMVPNEALIKWVKERKKEGLTRQEVIKKAKRTFGSERQVIKKIYKDV